VLDDVVEGLPARSGRGPPRSAAAGVRQACSRPRSGARAGPGARRCGSAGARHRPSCSRLPGRSSKISARISARASRWRSAQLGELGPAASGSRSRAARTERDTSVMEKRAWVTESWSSRARWARSSPAASSPPGGAGRVRAGRVRRRRAPRRAPDELAVGGHPRPVDLDQTSWPSDVGTAGASVAPRRVRVEPAEADGASRRATGRRSRRREAHQLGRLHAEHRAGCIADEGQGPLASVSQTRSGDEATR
jgi:hypothetical protein